LSYTRDLKNGKKISKVIYMRYSKHPHRSKGTLILGAILIIIAMIFFAANKLWELLVESAVNQ
jgi:hypothetical protein